ncbi:MAG TPA: putative metal-binding motif-containing protein, partial [Steroidobacteraceae bacterium]|nr:putative metal-binding motif-containing protein [Steroidobacteraceae bacterium]
GPGCSMVENVDCDDSDPNVNPGAPEVCNGVDDNCNGQVDEGLPTQSYYTDADSDGYGASNATAQVSCAPVSGKVTNKLDCNDANNAIHPGAAEVCNNVDDNCNGSVDEGNPGGGGACSTGQSGVCAAGTLTCSAGAITCVRNVAPSTEICDSLDNDCNGQTDELWPTKGQPCTAGLGVCARSGTNVCTADKTGIVCSATPGSPTAPACDGLDNDCDGLTDEPVITATDNVTSAVWTDVEVAPYYFSSGSCAGGVNGSGTDALAGGAMVMAGGQAGISFQKLSSAGQPTGSTTAPSSLTYSDVAVAQAGDGYIIAGIWSYSPEIDLYYVDASGTLRAQLWSQFNTGNTLDSLRVVRGNGKRVVLAWREAGVGVKMARIEPCYVSSAWEIDGAGCGAVSSTTLVSASTLQPGLGLDSNVPDWGASIACTSGLRKLGLGYIINSTIELHFITANEDGTGKSAVSTVDSESSPTTLTEPEVTFFSSSGDQYLVSWVTNYVGNAPPESDLNFWLTNAQSWHYAYYDYATDNGAASILRPRGSTTGSELWLTAERYITDSSGFKEQLMSRRLDLTGLKLPSDTDTTIEFSAMMGSCSGQPAQCRPGNKVAITHHAPFSRLYYSASGGSPAGSYESTLTCN